MPIKRVREPLTHTPDDDRCFVAEQLSETTAKPALAGSGAPEPEPERIATRREIEATPPISPAPDQHSDDPDVVATAPQPTPSQDQLYRGREQSKSARAHGKNNLHRSVGVGSQPAPLASPPVRDSMHAPKGFWDWSR